MRKSIQYILCMSMWVVLSCSHEKKENATSLKDSNQLPAKAPLFKQIPAAESGIDFNNTITENEKINLIDYFYLYNGGGVGIGDVNNDSLPDIYFTGNQVSSQLYLNKGNSGAAPGRNAPMRFENITQKAGVPTEGWCSGVTMVDINQDGWLDIYVCRAGNDVPAKRANLLFVNQGNDEQGTPVFTEKAKEYGLDYAGYSTQAAFFDYDKDGDLDMYLLNHTNEIRTPNNIIPIRQDGSGPSNDRLYRNDTPLFSTSRGDAGGRGVFVDVTKEAGILYDGLGLGVGISDLNGDGWEDIYVSNDFLANDQLYINNRDGTGRQPAFTDRSGEYLKHLSNFAMGNDLADFNNDGWVDIMVADMLPADNEQRKKMAGPMKYQQFEMGLKMGYQPQYMRNTLQLSNGINAQGKLTFSDIGQLTGVHATDWSWAPLWADFDNDGFKDLLITNGYRRDITDLDFVMYNASLVNTPDQQQADNIIKAKARQMPGLKKPNYIFRNKGDLTFENVTGSWGLHTPSYSNGAAYADLDNDGDLDLVINTIDDPALLYENTASDTLPNHYLRIHLKGSERNKAGLGATVRVYHDNHMQLYHHTVTRGYQSSVGYGIQTGLGNSSMIDSLEITWPDGKVQTLKDITANQTLQVDHANAKNIKSKVLPKTQPLFSEVTDNLQMHYTHQEDEYNDFSRDFLLPHKHSRMGPGIAVGDMNGDGRDDFFIGGAYEQSGTLYFQTSQGTFRSEMLRQEKKYEEDMGTLLFDADGDGDLDLYVASGSNEFGGNSEYYQDKFYLNDGKGNFKWTPEALPPMLTSTSCVTAADYDQDGDLDLFVGGRLTPSQYPFPGNSYVLQNNPPTPLEGGRGVLFTDVTAEVVPSLRKAGMVTAALWTDFNQDNWADLIVVGEFMPIQFYQNVEGTLQEVTNTTGLYATNGWWNSINGADFDNDGDTDYVLGNLGRNSRYQPTPDQPVSVYAADFDSNGSVDPILTYYLGGQEYPVHSRDDLLNQMAGLRQKFTRYATYANAQLTDIISGEALSQAKVVQATCFESSYLENMGKGRFMRKALPIEAQIAPVFGMLCEDFDRDHNVDILMVGNSYATEVVAGRYDASIGLLLKGDGQGNFQPVSHTQSGFFVDGDAKGLALLKGKDGKPFVVATQNDAPLRVFDVRNFSDKPSHLIKPASTDAWVVFTFADGTEQKKELYYGASYISQSSRTLMPPGMVVSITIYDYAGKSRIVYENKLSAK